MQLLVRLAAEPGRVIDARALAQHLWPGRAVDESSLRMQVAAVRQAIDDTGGRLLANVRGRGYYFAPPPAQAAPVEAHTPRHRRAPAAPVLTGRNQDLERLLTTVRAQRFVTLTGPGGVGKTALALNAAAGLAPDFPPGLCFVDLSRVAEDSSVPLAMALAFGLSFTGENPLPLLGRRLSSDRWLLVLDNCEHVADGVKTLVDELARRVPATHFLMTSREPIGMANETVFPLAPLGTAREAAQLPERDVGAEPVHSHAAALFVERARAVTGDAPFDAAALSMVEQICVNLDGLPLAIEIAAAQTAGLGITALAQRTGNLVRLLSRGRPGWPQRHRTLLDLLDWSYSLLDDVQQALLRQLAVFRGDFLRAEVVELAGGMGLTDAATEQALDALIRGSLVAASTHDGALRLLFTTRSYAENKLGLCAAEARLAWQRRALQLTAQLLSANQDLAQLAEADLPAWHMRHADRMVDVRACLGAVLATEADPRAVIELCIAAGPGVLEFALVGEFRPLLAKALALLPSVDPVDDELALRAHALSCFVGLVGATRADENARTLAHTLELATRAGSRDARIQAVYGLCAHTAAHGDYHAMTGLSLRLRELAGSDEHPGWHLIGRRFHALARLHLGHLDEAQRVFEDFRDHPWPLVARHYVGHTPLALQVNTWLARLLFLRSRSEEGLRLAEQALTLVDNRYSPLGITSVLALAAIPIAIHRGEHERAMAHVERLERHAAEHSISHWLPAAACYRRFLEHRMRGEPVSAELLTPLTPQVTDLMATLDDALVTQASVARVRQGAVGWNASAVLGAATMQRWRLDGDHQAAMDALQAAIDLAHRQGALAWSLRGTVQLAELLDARADPAAAARALRDELERHPAANGAPERRHAEHMHARLQGRLQNGHAPTSRRDAR